MTKVITPNQIGYWIKAENEKEALGLVVQIALDHGMALSDVETKIYEAFKRGETVWPCPDPAPDQDIVEMVIGPNGLSERSEAWLNENAVPEGLKFGWWNGFFLLQMEWAWKADQDAKSGQ